MNRIDGRAKTLRGLLSNTRYTVDFYQREYAWEERQVRDLIDDLTGKFLDFYDASHAREAVERYGHYFLGSIVVSNKRSQRFIVDGQQRLTTLSLLLIFLHHRLAGRTDTSPLAPLVYSERYGRKDFNLDVEERRDVMQALLDNTYLDTSNATASVRNIAARYANIADHFPDEIADQALPYFIDWLIDNVHLVEIEAYSDEDAYTIFETMNDRGLPLSLPDMLKGYILANIANEADQRAVNHVWKQHMQALKSDGPECDTDFFKDWLRARYADTMRTGKKGAENRDYERIGGEFHRWVRDQRERIGLIDSASYVSFVKKDLDAHAHRAREVHAASIKVTPGWESIYYNQERSFTLQRQLILAALDRTDPAETARRKVALVADFVDIWLTRRVWSFRTIAYSSVKYTIFNLTKEVRGRSLANLSVFLQEQLAEQPETFAGEPRLRLHAQNYRQIRHILARITHWVDTQCGLTTHFEDLVSEGRARPFEVEHIWADKFSRYASSFAHEADFELARNRLGGLLLLQRGVNQSLGDAPYDVKREAYATKGDNLLARSLHPAAYTNNPAFRALIDRTGLAFRPYDLFGPAEQAERQELYIRLAEWVWNPSRLALDGERPPVHQPLHDVEEPLAGNFERGDGPAARLRFWQALLPVAATRLDLHARVRPSDGSWVGTHRQGYGWNYVVSSDQVRAECYIDDGEVADNKALFDAIHRQRETIEVAFGGPLHWQRLDDRRACRISASVPGGWGDERTWPAAIDSAVDAMARLYAALAPVLNALSRG
jgi:hypothetical protein